MKKISIIILFALILSIFVVGIYFYNEYNDYLKFSSFINESSIEYNIDPLLIISIIKAESDFNVNAVSKKGAIGLMQIMPSTAKELVSNNQKYDNFVSDDLYEPKTNIDLGTAYLQYLLKVFNNDTSLALSAYNAGVGNVLKWNESNKVYNEDKILFKETKKYVKKVNGIYKILKEITKFLNKN